MARLDFRESGNLATERAAQLTFWHGTLLEDDVFDRSKHEGLVGLVFRHCGREPRWSFG